MTKILKQQSILFSVSWFRLVIYSAAFAGMILLQLLQGDFLNLEVWQKVNVIMLVPFLSHLVLVEQLNNSEMAENTLSLILTLNGLVLAALLAVIGVNHSAFLFLLLLIVAFSSFSLGLVSGLKIGLWSVALFNFTYSFNHVFAPETLKTSFVINNFSVFIVAFIGGLLGDQIQFASEDIEAKAAEIQILTDLNELIVENIPSGIFIVDASRKILKVNRGAARIFEDLSLDGRALNEFFPELATTIDNFNLHDRANVYERHELNFLNYKSEKLVLEVIVAPIKRRSQPFNQFVILVQNLTIIKNLEFAMRQKEKLAAVGQLAAGIAHEIRNPLASISGSAQLLQANLQTQTPEDKKLLNIVIKEIDRLNNLISEFLDFVRPDIRIEDPININTLAREVLEMAKVNDRLARNVEQRLELRSQGIILGQFDKLKQAILNIVINAYQAMGDTLRPEIFVQTYDKEDRVYLIIQDNGIGMTSDNIKRIFEPFHTTKPSGTGLGLAITHKILETHNAQINVESELGQGTKFIISYPTGLDPDREEIKLKRA